MQIIINKNKIFPKIIRNKEMNLKKLDRANKNFQKKVVN